MLLCTNTVLPASHTLMETNAEVQQTFIAVDGVDPFELQLFVDSSVPGTMANRFNRFPTMTTYTVYSFELILSINEWKMVSAAAFLLVENGSSAYL